VTAEGAGDTVGCSAYLYLYGPQADDVDPDAWAARLRSALEPGPGTAR